MNPVEDFLEKAPQIEERIGYTFSDKHLLLRAFTHRSFINEHQDLVQHHYERLEFLGDSILGFLIAHYLFILLPDTAEGELSSLRATLVQGTACSRYFERLDLVQHALVGKGERLATARGRESLQADLFESIIGAIYLDGGMEAAKAFLFDNFQEDLNELRQAPSLNAKADLQDLTQREHGETPTYEVLEESGPDHDKSFVIAVSVDGKELGRGTGTSKKEAQQAAAREALTWLK